MACRIAFNSFSSWCGLSWLEVGWKRPVLTATAMAQNDTFAVCRIDTANEHLSELRVFQTATTGISITIGTEWTRPYQHRVLQWYYNVTLALCLARTSLFHQIVNIPHQQQHQHHHNGSQWDTRKQLNRCTSTFITLNLNSHTKGRQIFIIKQFRLP